MRLSLPCRSPYETVNPVPRQGIRVELPNYGMDPQLGPSGIPIFTKLFRERSLLPEGLAHLYQRRSSGSELSIVSAACSIGAEADSIVALHNRTRFGGRLALTGYDIKEEVLALAREGQYTLSPHHPVLYGEGTGKRAKEILREYGFTIIPSTVEPLPGVSEEDDTAHYQVDATPVRQGHDIAFEAQDIRELTTEREADLVYANNFFYHLPPDEATEALLSLAYSMGKASILGLGARDYAEVLMGESDTRYSDWLAAASAELTDRFAAKPLIETNQGIPVMFSIN